MFESRLLLQGSQLENYIDILYYDLIRGHCTNQSLSQEEINNILDQCQKRDTKYHSKLVNQIQYQTMQICLCILIEKEDFDRLHNQSDYIQKVQENGIEINFKLNILMDGIGIFDFLHDYQNQLCPPATNDATQKKVAGYYQIFIDLIYKKIKPKDPQSLLATTLDLYRICQGTFLEQIMVNYLHRIHHYLKTLKIKNSKISWKSLADKKIQSFIKNLLMLDDIARGVTDQTLNPPKKVHH